MSSISIQLTMSVSTFSETVSIILTLYIFLHRIMTIDTDIRNDHLGNQGKLKADTFPSTNVAKCRY